MNEEGPFQQMRSDGDAGRSEVGLLSLSELSSELNARTDIFDVASVALFNLMGHFSCTRGAFWILQETEEREAVLIRTQGLAEPLVTRLGGLWAQWLCEQPGGFTHPALVSDLEPRPEAPELDLLKPAGIALFGPVIVRGTLRAMIALGQPVGDVEFGLAERELLQTSLNLIGVAVENISLYNRSVENIRQLRRANEQLQELDSLKSDFLSNLNHEFRTPITIMTAYLELLVESEPDAERQEQLSAVRAQATAIQSMMLKLLDFANLEHDALEVHLLPGDIDRVIKRYAEDRRPGVSAELRDLRVSIAADLPPLFFDADRVVQVVDALVDNATKFSPPGARILIRVDADNHGGRDWVRIDVEDNGPGIDPDRLPHIFESFRQGDGSSTRRQGGIGLGLALARELATKMGGTLDVASELGVGAVFSLRLPTG
ncbi:MAG: hypothetical protein DHS20C21_21600 [Gemmatimonadota bacterium]|nr:MAG: hypothetical protein DHS20C21_21600 [Gemmatimonadota bacterium]